MTGQHQRNLHKGDWRTGKRGIGYHHCPSINTIGKIEIGISKNLQQIQQFVNIDINSNIDDFDFDQLKNDFEGELWSLITSKKSIVSSEKNEVRYGNKTFHYTENQSIIGFIKAFDNITRSPKQELSHAKELRKLEKVIPIAETYRKLSTAGTAALLPSKAVSENHDIYENRLVCFMLHSIFSIASANLKYTSLQIQKWKSEIETITQKITILQDPDPKVNPEKITVEILFQEQRVNALTNHWRGISDTLPQNAEGTYQLIRINVKHSHHLQGNNFWCGSNVARYCLIEFPNHVLQYISEGTEFIFEAIINRQGLVQTNSGSYPRFLMVSARKIASTELTTEQKILERQKNNKAILEINEWKQFTLLSQSERNKFIKERNNQVQTLRKKIKKISVLLKNIDEFNDEQSLLFQQLEQRLKTNFFKKVKWKNFQGFKPSMTFIQNIAYRNALRHYKDILKSEGIDIEIFDLYENVTSFGLREMPQVYELWSLVTIIRALEESFHFKHNKNDLKLLLKVINPEKQLISQHVRIDFGENLAKRSVTLHYQKSITDNKRPDFILEVTCNGRTINLVLDSKFKNYNYKKSIVYDTIDMANKYSADTNYVFILHPCRDGTFEDRNIKYTNHGGERIFYGEEEEKQIKYPFHEYGYIELKPNFTDSLKKLMAMSFEYLLESSRNAKQDSIIDPKPENEMFCMSCGNENITISCHKRGNNRSYYDCTCNEVDCGHKIYIDYCWNCQTKLFKHGSYWDYHLESTWSTFDIHCPNCGKTVGDRP